MELKEQIETSAVQAAASEPRQMTVKEHVTFTVKVLAITGSVVGAILGIDHWIAGQ